MDIAGRVAVVTGAASGIGLALAERSAAGGTSVVPSEVEAIRDERFRIITPGVSWRRSKQRNADLEAGRNPQPPPSGKP